MEFEGDGRKYRVFVLRSVKEKDPQKTYSTNDMADANRIYEHWIDEADSGNVIIMVGVDKGNREAVIKVHAKKGKGEMTNIKDTSSSPLGGIL